MESGGSFVDVSNPACSVSQFKKIRNSDNSPGANTVCIVTSVDPTARDHHGAFFN